MPEWVLPWPPVLANNLYRTVVVQRADGRRVTRRALVPRAEAWRDEVILAVRLSGAVAPPGDLWLTIVAHEPDNRRRDTDSPIKPTADAVCLALEIDDTRIRRIEATRLRPRRGEAACLRVTLEGVEAA